LYPGTGASKVTDERATSRQAIHYFAAYGHCHKLLTALRWPDGKVECPRCGSGKVHYLVRNRVWKCYGAHQQARFSLKAGTIFEDSPIPLEKWLAAIWIWLNTESGISSWQLHRILGVTQKTAWFMLHRIRLALEGWNLDERPKREQPFPGGVRFENAPEFARFRSAMRALLRVSKATLDDRVARARAASPRLASPRPPGRKPRRGMG